MIHKLHEVVKIFEGRTIGVLGLSFKPDTDDVRDAPALEMIEVLLKEGAVVRAYDPVAGERARERFPDLICCEDPYSAAENADAVVLMTEWNEFRNIDLPRIHAALAVPARFLDCRNIYDPREMRELGFLAFASEVLVSHAYVHLVDVGVPVTVGGLEVKSGDIVMGDQHGVTSVPIEIAADIPDAPNNMHITTI